MNDPRRRAFDMMISNWVICLLPENKPTAGPVRLFPSFSGTFSRLPHQEAGCPRGYKKGIFIFFFFLFFLFFFSWGGFENSGKGSSYWDGITCYLEGRCINVFPDFHAALTRYGETIPCKKSFFQENIFGWNCGKTSFARGGCPSKTCSRSLNQRSLVYLALSALKSSSVNQCLCSLGR